MRQWISWIQPTGDYRPLVFPPLPDIMGWWCSGYDSDDNATLCALVEADSEEGARSKVLAYWPEAVGWRFCEERDEEWRPNDRFPLPDWSPLAAREPAGEGGGA